uniref:Uncharacterized protein n=1 Tax=Acrobeloides nanus TaxID=290746 RepID=A0A914BV12_9BILA
MFLPSLMYAVSSYMVLNCLDGISMPLFPPLQRLCPLAIVVIGACYYRMQMPSREAIVLIVIICFGTALSSIADWSVDLWALIYGLGSLGMFALCLVKIEKLHEQYSSTLELIYMNSFNCLCLFLIADLVQDEIRDSFMYLVTSTTWLFVLCLTLLVIIGSIFHALIFYCITDAGALHTAIMHNLAGGVQIFVAYSLSVYLFYDLAPSSANIFGVIIASIAASYYYLSGRCSDINFSPSMNRYMPVKS